MVFVDIHSHLDFKDFDKDRVELEIQMKEQNIKTLTNTLNPSNYEYTKQLFEKSSQISVCPGLYPTDAIKISDIEFDNYLKLIKKEINAGKVKAIGEVGLDFYHTKDEDEHKIQIKRFKQILEFAHKNDTPIIIHTRKAEAKVIEIIADFKQTNKFNKIVLHCFTGKKRLIKDIVSLKLYCSIPLSILNTQSFQILVEGLPISQILAETDSPFLNPQKTRNSPLNIPLVYKEIAKIKGLDQKEIENILYKNYMGLMI